MNVFFTSDLHFGHFNILRYDSRPFASIAEMDAEIVARWNSVVKNEDVTYILGDVSWRSDSETAELLKQLNGKKILIVGNHDDIRNIGEKSQKEFAEIHFGYWEIFDKELHKKVILSHYPIHFWNGQRKGAIMLYGHVHNMLDHEAVKDAHKLVDALLGIQSTMINVGCMHWDYTPQTLQQMLMKMKGT